MTTYRFKVLMEQTPEVTGVLAAANLVPQGSGSGGIHPPPETAPG
jgi:hypothetical protein